jgi:hypothetical protein
MTQRDKDPIEENLSRITNKYFPNLALWDADPNCKHEEVSQPGGGVKCIKCNGWFCF